MCGIRLLTYPWFQYQVNLPALEYEVSLCSLLLHVPPALSIPHKDDNAFFEHTMLKHLKNIFLVTIFFAIDKFVHIVLATLSHVGVVGSHPPLTAR